MNIDNLRRVEDIDNQRVVENHKRLCEILEVTYFKGGKQRQNQIEEFKRYFRFVKKPYKPYIIYEIYDEPLPKINKKNDGNNSIYAGKLDDALQWLWEQGKLDGISLTKLALELNILPDGTYAYFKSPKAFLSDYEGKESLKLLSLDNLNKELVDCLWGSNVSIEHYEYFDYELCPDTRLSVFDMFYNLVFARCSRIMLDNLKRMESKDIIQYKKVLKVVYLNKTQSIATHEELKRIKEIRVETEKEFDSKDIKKNSILYKAKIIEKLKMELSIKGTYNVYFIHFKEPFKVVSEQIFIDSVDVIKKKFFQACIKTFYRKRGIISHFNQEISSISSCELNNVKNMLEQLIKEKLSSP